MKAGAKDIRISKIIPAGYSILVAALARCGPSYPDGWRNRVTCYRDCTWYDCISILTGTAALVVLYLIRHMDTRLARILMIPLLIATICLFPCLLKQQSLLFTAYLWAVHRPVLHRPPHRLMPVCR